MNENKKPENPNAFPKSMNEFGYDGMTLRDYFANSATTVAYKEEIIRLINGWVNTEMRMLNGQLLERSEMFYYPTITKGTVKIKADNDKLITR